MIRTVEYGLSGPLPDDDVPLPYFDGYWLRLIKLVPWEMGILFASLCFLLPEVDSRLLVLFTGVLLLPLFYFLINVLIFSVPPEKQPLTHYYVLAAVNLALSGCAIADATEFFGLNSNTFLVAAGVWLIAAPLLDLLLEQLFAPYYPSAI